MEIKHNKTGFYIDNSKLDYALSNRFLQEEDLSQIMTRIAAIEKKIKILKHRNWRKHGRTR